MNSTLFVPIVKRISDLIGQKTKAFNLRDEYHNDIDFANDTDGFIDGLTDKARRIELALLRSKMKPTELRNRLIEAEYPLLVFADVQGTLSPVIFHRPDGSSSDLQAFVFRTETEVFSEEADTLLARSLVEPDGTITVILPLSVVGMVTESEQAEDGKEIGPVSRLIRLLKAEKRDIFYVYFYSVLIALIGLTLPVGVQAVMELISGGVVVTSLTILISLVIGGVLAVGILQLMQYSVVEVLERRIFVKAAFEFSFRIPHLRGEDLMYSYAPELMNRFFDVLTLQKGLPKLLIDVSGSIIQIIFGLLLISFYHPLFIFFGVGLLTVLVIVFYFTGIQGLKTALIESKYKYKLVHWLEELARSLYSFKLAGHTALPMQKTEYYTDNYLHYRKKHFKVLMTQYINIVGFRTLVTGGLLILGSFLVIDRQITLGQFVASEIVVVTIMSASEKFILSMNTVYDMLAAVDKIASVTDLPLEKKGGISLPFLPDSPAEIRIKNVTYRFPESTEAALKNIDLRILPGERLCLAGFAGAGKNTLVDILAGLLDNYEGIVTYNNISLRDINLTSFRDNLAKNTGGEELFEGTIWENISMGKSRLTFNDAARALNIVGLSDFVNSLPKGWQTEIVPGGKQFSSTVGTKLIIARCIAQNSNLLIINDLLHDLEKSDKFRILSELIKPELKRTLVFVSNDPLIMTACDRTILMKNGEIVASGTYEDLSRKTVFAELVLLPSEISKKMNQFDSENPETKC